MEDKKCNEESQGELISGLERLCRELFAERYGALIASDRCEHLKELVEDWGWGDQIPSLKEWDSYVTVTTQETIQELSEQLPACGR